VLLAVVAGAIATGIGLRRALEAERVARQEAESSRQVSDFLVQLFRASGPDQTKGEVVTARTLLDRGTTRIETELQDDPLVRSRLLEAISGSYLGLGNHDEGVRLAREALTAAEAAEPRPGLEVARRLFSLAQALVTVTQVDSVLVFVDRAIAILETSEETDHDLLAQCFSRKALLWSNQGNGALADSFITKALSLAESEPKPDPLRLMGLHSTKAYLAHARFDLETAERHYVRAFELAKQTDQPVWIALGHSRLAGIYSNLGDHEKAVSHAEEGVRLARKLYSGDHRNVADAVGGLARALSLQGRDEEAAVAWEECVRIERSNGTPAGLTFALGCLGNLYHVMGKMDLAIACAEECAELSLRTWGPRQIRSAGATAGLARIYAAAKSPHQADSTFRAAIDVMDDLGDTSILTVEAHLDYAKFCRDEGWSQRADSSFLRAEAMLDSTQTGSRAFLGRCLIEHAYLRSLEDRHDEAEAMMRTGFPLRRGDAAEDDADLGDSYLTWAAVRARAGDAGGVGEKLALATRCGVSDEDKAHYPELADYELR
jgi:serine/threonine-protein kinase